LAAKENRAARVDRNVLIDKLLDLFKKYKIWALRDLKARVNQPEAYLREVLSEIAVMWKNGDWTGKWELKKEYQELDAKLMNPESSLVAPAAEDSEMDRSGMDEDDENETFEDV
jgi:transcription initiation factor TFIIF subunit beta